MSLRVVRLFNEKDLEGLKPSAKVILVHADKKADMDAAIKAWEVRRQARLNPAGLVS